MDAGNPPVDPRGMRYERAMPVLWAPDWRAVCAGFRPCVLTPAWQSGPSRRGRVSRNCIALGAGPRQPVACEARGRLWRGRLRVHVMAGLLSGGGGVTASVFPCRGGSAVGPRHLSPGKGLCGWSRDTSAGGLSPPAYRQTCPGCAPLWLHAGGFVN